MNVSTEAFKKIAIECNIDLDTIVKTLRERYPDVEHRPYRVMERIKTLRTRGQLPLDSGNTVSIGEVLRGTSTLFSGTGAIKQQWVKTDVLKETQLTAFSTAIDSILTRLTPSVPVLSPGISEEMKDYMSIYTIGDAHIGMLSWKPETGEDNDLEISEARHIKAMELLVSQSRPTYEAFIVDVGDFFHSDNIENRTAASGHSLDVDGRYAKVLAFGLNLTTKLIDLALTKHQIVHWRSAIGNHNDHSAIMMNQFIKAYYRNEPRVVVHDEPSMYMYHQFGKNLIGITHGHKTKADNLGSIMSVDCEEIWSSTKFRYWYTGHVHHQSVKEYPSCVVETFRTLAGKDAWHAATGYRSKQDMRCILLHKDFGEVSRNTVSLNMIQAFQ